MSSVQLFQTVTLYPIPSKACWSATASMFTDRVRHVTKGIPQIPTSVLYLGKKKMTWRINNKCNQILCRDPKNMMPPKQAEMSWTLVVLKKDFVSTAKNWSRCFKVVSICADKLTFLLYRVFQSKIDQDCADTALDSIGTTYMDNVMLLWIFWNPLVIFKMKISTF